MKRFAFFATLSLVGIFTPFSQARLFTDDQGRQVEAELVGFRGPNVVLAAQHVRGQWPLAKLSPPDQAYAREWQKANTTVKQATVQVTERDGIGVRGEFAKPKSETAKNESGGLPPGLKDLPLAPPVETKTGYKHYEVTVGNPARVDANYLKVAYVVYVIRADGSVGISPGVQAIPSLPAGQTARITTEGVSATQTKATKLKLNVSSSAFSVREKTARSKDEFGGAWIKVSGPDGTVIGESRRLSPELQKLDPPWEEAEVQEDIPELKSLDGLLELLKKVLPPPPPGIPAGPGQSKERPGPPGFPPPPQ